MRPLYLLTSLSLFLCANTPAQVLGVIGSSTAAGGGASIFDSSWVARTALYYQNLGQLTTYHDIAWSGSTTWNGMPTSYVFPNGLTITQADTPDRADNETALLQLGCDVVIVAYPNNDIVNGFSLTQYLSNLHLIYDSVVKAGKTCWISSTQPRDDIPLSTRQILLQGKDSIMAEFPSRSLDFWDPVVDPSTLGILSQYSAGDDIHLNNAGHALLAQVAEEAGIMDPTPLALSLTGFTAGWTGQGVLLQWTMAHDGAPDAVTYNVQRSPNSQTFTTIYSTGATTAATATSNWSWTDTHCPNGTSYYRLSWTEDAQTMYSKIVSIDHASGALSIDKVYLPGGSQLISEIQLPSSGSASIAIMDLSGHYLLRAAYSGLPLSATLSISLPPMASGEYVLKVVTPDGQQSAKPFVIF